MTRLLTDIRLAVRTLLKTRGLATMAVLTLGLGMTLCTMAMVVVNAYLFSELPYPNADRLHWIRYGAPGQPQPRGLESLDWRAAGDVIEFPVAWDLDMFYLLGGEHAESAPGAWVTRGFVEALGIRPAVGRGFDDAAFATGAEHVAIISHRLWMTRFGGDPAIVGRTFAAYVSDRPHETERFTIIGVLPQHFWHLNPYTDILAPLRAPSFPYMARLRDGVTAAAASARLRAFVAGATAVPDDWAVTVVSAHEAHVTTLRPMLQTAGAAAALVMLVACANVAGLLLIRATRRQRELAVRSALGASRSAIARMLLAEGLVFGGAATIVAVVTTWTTMRWLAPAVEQQLGRSAPGGSFAFAVDWRALAFATTVGLLTAVVCTVVPLAALRRPQLMPALQGAQRGATEGRRTQRMRAVLMTVEVAASLALLVGSAVMLRSVVALMRTDLGISAERVLNASLTLRQTRYPDADSRAAAFDRLVGRVATIPGVQSVGLTTAWPLQQPADTPIDVVDGAARSVRAGLHGVSDAYFSVLAVPVVTGRGFLSTDRIGSEPVAIVSESLARRLWPAGDGVGTRVAVPQPRERGEPVVVRRRIVGIVRDVRQGPADADQADLYVPMRQSSTRFAFLLVRTAGAPAAAVPALLDAARDVDPELVVHRARPLQAIVREATARPRFMASLLTCFALAGAILALVGVYGVIAYAVRQREREIAVRLAVGADPSRIVRLFVRQGGAILSAGLAAGVVTALAAGRLVESQMFGITFRDPIAVAAAVVAFGGAGLLAVWWPARRAAATDPAIALRAE